MNSSVIRIRSEILDALTDIHNEQALLELLESKFAELNIADPKWQGRIEIDREYPNSRQLLKIKEYIEKFVDLTEEIQTIIDLDHAQSLLKDLLKIRDNLKDFAVSKRVAKETRSLQQKMPGLQNIENEIKDHQLNSRIVNLQNNGPKCGKGHRLVIREGGANGYFWGCERFPDCFSTRQLSKKEWNYLFPEDSDDPEEVPANIPVHQISVAPGREFLQTVTAYPSETSMDLQLLYTSNGKTKRISFKKSNQNNITRNKALGWAIQQLQQEISSDDESKLLNFEEVAKVEKRTDIEEALFGKLKEWRTRLSREVSMPAYIIADNATIRNIASSKPKNKHELLAVNGIGPAKLEKYGDDILEIVSDFQ